MLILFHICRMNKQVFMTCVQVYFFHAESRLQMEAGYENTSRLCTVSLVKNMDYIFCVFKMYHKIWKQSQKSFADQFDGLKYQNSLETHDM